MVRVAIAGFGAIGSRLIELLGAMPQFAVASVLASPRSVDAARQRLRTVDPRIEVASRLQELPTPPQLLVECAGHSAIDDHVEPALAQGIPCIAASVGAFADPQRALRVEEAARHGGVQLHLVSGAVGAIDALAAARIGGLESVVYTGRKPPGAWEGTLAADACRGLDADAPALLIFEGSASQAARAFPKNANVAATIALAGLGMEQTRVRLYADPRAGGNVHEIAARGAFGEFELTLRGHPMASNPKTSMLTVLSIARALDNHTRSLIL